MRERGRRLKCSFLHNTQKRERTQGWRLKPFFTLAHNNNTIEEGNTLYVKP